MQDRASEDLQARQSALQAEAARMLSDVGLLPVLEELALPLFAGSYVSGLMTWREVDVMVLAGAQFSPAEVLALMSRIVALPGVVGFEYADERADRSPTGAERDQRYHLPITVEHATGGWSVDLTVWLHDDHRNVTAWHERLRDSITSEQRAAVLWIKDVWRRRPEYPGQVGGQEVYSAVLEHGVRTPQEFEAWLVGGGGVPSATG